MGQTGRWRGEFGDAEGMWKGRGCYTTKGATRNVVIFETMGGEICKLRQVICLSSVLTNCQSGVVFRVLGLQGLMSLVTEQKVKDRTGSIQIYDRIVVQLSVVAVTKQGVLSHGTRNHNDHSKQKLRNLKSHNHVFF